MVSQREPHAEQPDVVTMKETLPDGGGQRVARVRRDHRAAHGWPCNVQRGGTRHAVEQHPSGQLTAYADFPEVHGRAETWDTRLWHHHCSAAAIPALPTH
jgi:hypothetical protein